MEWNLALRGGDGSQLLKPGHPFQQIVQEYLDLLRFQPATRVIGGDVDGRSSPTGKKPSQGSPGHVVFAQLLRQKGGAEARYSQSVDCGDVADTGSGIELHLVAASAVHKDPEDRGQASATEQRARCQLFRFRGTAPTGHERTPISAPHSTRSDNTFAASMRKVRSGYLAVLSIDAMARGHLEAPRHVSSPMMPSSAARYAGVPSITTELSK